jgi:c-di-GMP-binding flagellar brake protein YcgR
VSDLPRVNQHVGLSVDGSLDTLSSRVEDRGDGWLALAPPAIEGRTQWLRSGTAVTVQWVTPRGLGVVHGMVRGSANLGVRAFVVELIGEPDIVQRRRHVRADSFVRIVVTPALPSDARQPAIGTTLDVAGGGLRARVPGWLEPGDLVRVRILLDDDEEVSALARVVRRIDEQTVGFEFEDIGIQERERLVRHVFRRLRQALVARDG